MNRIKSNANNSTWNITYGDPEEIQNLKTSHTELLNSLEWIYAKIAKDPRYFNDDEVYQWYLSACRALVIAERVKK